MPELPGIVVRSWGQGPAVLLVHGWGGRGGQLWAFVQPLLEAGYRVVALDGPAHGESPGAQTDALLFSDAVAALAAHLERAPSGLHAVVGHSFGAACALYALRAAATARLVLIGCPPSAVWVTERFGEALRISPKVLARMRELISAPHRQRFRWQELSMVTLAARSRSALLLVHDEQDRMIPYEASALEFLRAAPWLEHLCTRGLGHRGLLGASEVIERVCEFSRRSPASSEHLDATA